MKVSTYSDRIGGFVSVNTGNIRDCYTDSKVKYKENTAGFVYENNGNIAFSVAWKPAAGKKNIGGFCFNNKGRITDSGWTVLSGQKIDGERYSDSELAVECENAADVFSALRFGEAWIKPDKGADRIKLSALPSKIEDRDYIEIDSAETLFAVASDIAGGDADAASKCYILTSDINLHGKKWIPIGISDTVPFTGVFDGGGHKIHNFKIKSKNLDYGGFFGVVSGGSVLNLSLDCVVDSRGGRISGAMCGYNDKGKFFNCHVAANVSAEKLCGGFIGKNSGDISSCSFVGKVASAFPIAVILSPIIGVLVALLIIGLILLIGRFKKTPYGPEIIDPNQRPIVDTGTYTPPPAGSNRISFEMNQVVYINFDTQVGILNYVNPKRSTQDVVIRVLVSDAELIKTIGKTGRTASEQARLEADPDYSAENSFSELFRSGRIQIGYGIEAIKLGTLADGTVLPEGDYEMIVVMDAYNPETFEKSVVNAQAPIQVHIVKSEQ